MTTKKFIFAATLAIILAACGNVTKEQAGPTAIDGNTVALSPAQLQSAALEFGQVTQRPMKTIVAATGLLDVPPQNMISVSPPMGGFVKHTNLLQGMRVRKGAVLVELEHPDYIQLQQDFLSGVSELNYLEAAYKRQETLAEESINAQKSLQEAKAKFESMKANVDGLRVKLSLLNINEEQLKERGIARTIRLYAPVGGYVTEVNINLGSYASPNDVMIRLVNTEHLHAELKVFENDIPKIKLGQSVMFNLINDTTTHRAEVYLIGRQVLPDRTVSVHCHLEKEDAELIPGMFIKGQIISEAGMQPVLPDAAVVNYEEKHYIFVATADDHIFRMEEIEVLGQRGGYTAISVALDPGTKVVTKGAYTLLSLKFNTEEEE